MKTVWKWILGIVIALVVIGLVVGAVFAVQHRFTFAARTSAAPFAFRQFQQATPSAPGKPAPQNNQAQPSAPTNPKTPNTPNRTLPGRGYGFGYGPMMGRGPMMMGRGPMMMGRGYNRSGTSNRFGALGVGFMFMGLVGLIVMIAFLAGVAFVFYQLGKNAGIAATLLAQQASNGSASADSPPAKTTRGRR